jgi:hypothetical protein
MAHRRARRHVARRHRGGPAAYGGRPPALHTIPYLDNPHARTAGAHPDADIPHPAADNSHPAADISHRGTVISRPAADVSRPAADNSHPRADNPGPDAAFRSP